MKDYHRVLEIQNSILKNKTRYNKYIKIKIQTYDEKLKELIQDRLDNRDKSSFDILKIYCENQIKLQIPTWQIAAKKAGWQSPSKQKKVILNLGK